MNPIELDKTIKAFEEEVANLHSVNDLYQRIEKTKALIEENIDLMQNASTKVDDAKERLINCVEEFESLKVSFINRMDELQTSVSKGIELSESKVKDKITESNKFIDNSLNLAETRLEADMKKTSEAIGKKIDDRANFTVATLEEFAESISSEVASCANRIAEESKLLQQKLEDLEKVTNQRIDKLDADLNERFEALGTQINESFATTKKLQIVTLVAVAIAIVLEIAMKFLV